MSSFPLKVFSIWVRRSAYCLDMGAFRLDSTISISEHFRAQQKLKQNKMFGTLQMSTYTQQTEACIATMKPLHGAWRLDRKTERHKEERKHTFKQQRMEKHSTPHCGLLKTYWGMTAPCYSAAAILPVAQNIVFIISKLQHSLIKSDNHWLYFMAWQSLFVRWHGNYISCFIFGKFGVATLQFNMSVTSATSALQHNVVHRKIEAFIYLFRKHAGTGPAESEAKTSCLCGVLTLQERRASGFNYFYISKKQTNENGNIRGKGYRLSHISKHQFIIHAIISKTSLYIFSIKCCLT